MPNTTTDTEVNELIINTLTKAQYDELVANDQINENELYLTKDEEYITPFEVIYNTTTYAAITSALTAKQEPVCNYNNYHYIYAGKDSTYYYLTCAINSEIKYVRVNSSNTWSNGTAAIPQGTVTSVRVQAGTGLSSSTSTAQTTSLDTTISIASGYKLPTTTEWSGKQDALTTQTAYSAKGSATKVPQITTNTLGQVTAITEVTITQPTVNNKTITIQKNSTTVDSFTLNQSTDKTINITLAKGDVGLGNVDNTSDANKPISTATQTALDGKQATISDLEKIRTGAQAFYVKGTQNASTNAFTGTLSAVSALYEGLTINYWLPYAGTSTAATLELTLAGGTTTGAINCYYAGTTRLTTHLSANCVGNFVYQTVTIGETEYTGWWLLKAYYTEGSNTYDREYDNYYRAYAGMALPKYGLLMKGVNGRLYSIVATYGTATNKVVTTVGLRPDLIWWNNANATTNAGAVIKAQALYRSMPSTAGSSVFNASVPTYCDIYLCGDYDENTGLFYLATTDANGNASVTDYYRFVPYNSEPVYSNYFITGRYYIFVGSSYSTANYYQLMDQHPMYYYDGTNLIGIADKPKYAATFIDWE